MRKLTKIKLKEFNELSDSEMKKVLGGQYGTTQTCGSVKKPDGKEVCEGKCDPKVEWGSSGSKHIPQVCKEISLYSPDLSGSAGMKGCGCVNASGYA